MISDDEEGKWDIPQKVVEAQQHEEVLKAARTLSCRIAADLSTWQSGKPLPSVRDAALARGRLASGANNVCNKHRDTSRLSYNDVPCSSFGRAHAGGVPKDYGFTTKDINDAINYNREREEQLFCRYVVPSAEQYLKVLKKQKDKQLNTFASHVNPLTWQSASDELAQLSQIHPRLAGSCSFPTPCQLRTSLGSSFNTLMSNSCDQDVGHISPKGPSGVSHSHLHNNPSYLQKSKSSSPPPTERCRKVCQGRAPESTSDTVRVRQAPDGKNWNSSTFVDYYQDDLRIKKPHMRGMEMEIENVGETEIPKNGRKRSPGRLISPNQKMKQDNKTVARAHVNLDEISHQRPIQRGQEQNISMNKNEISFQHTVLPSRTKSLNESISVDFDSRVDDTDKQTISDTRRHFTTLIRGAMSLISPSEANNQRPMNIPLSSSQTSGGLQFSSEEKLCRYYLKLLNISLPQDDSNSTVHTYPFDDPIKNGAVMCTLINGVVEGLQRATKEILNTVGKEHQDPKRIQEIQKVSEALKSLNTISHGDILRGLGDKTTSTTNMLQRLQRLYCEVQSRLKVLQEVFSYGASSGEITIRLRNALISISCVTGVNSQTQFSDVVSVGTDDRSKKQHLKNRGLQEVLAGRCQNVWLVIANIILAFFVSSPPLQANHPRQNLEGQASLDVSVAEDRHGVITIAPSPGQYASAVFNHYHTSHSASSTSVSACCVKYSTSLLKKLDYAVCQFILDLQVLPSIPTLVTSEAKRELSPTQSENPNKTSQYLEAMQDPTKAPYVPESACFNPTRQTSALSAPLGTYQGNCSKFQPRMDPFYTILTPTVFPYLRNGTLLYDIGVKLLGEVPNRDTRKSPLSSPASGAASFSRNPKVKSACLANITLAQQLFMKHALKSDPPLATHCLTDPVAVYEGDTVFLLSLLEDIMRFAFKKQPRKLATPSIKGLYGTQQSSKLISSALQEPSKRTIGSPRETLTKCSDGSEPFIPPRYEPTIKSGSTSNGKDSGNQWFAFTSAAREGAVISNEDPLSMHINLNSHCYGGGASGLSVGGSSRPQVIINSDSKMRNLSPYNFNLDGDDEDENNEKSIEPGRISEDQAPTYFTNTLYPCDSVAPGRYNNDRKKATSSFGNMDMDKEYSTDDGNNRESELKDPSVVYPLGNPHLAYLNNIDHSDRESNQLAVWLIRKLKTNYQYIASDGSFEVNFKNVSRYEQELEALCPRYVPVTTSSPSSLGNKRVSTVLRYLIFSDGVVLYHLLCCLVGSSVTSRLKGIQLKPKNIATKKLNVRKIIAFLSQEKKLFNGYVFLEDAVVAGDQRAVILILRQLKEVFKNHID